jgi:hypothetical protein
VYTAKATAAEQLQLQPSSELGEITLVLQNTRGHSIKRRTWLYVEQRASLPDHTPTPQQNYDHTSPFGSTHHRWLAPKTFHNNKTPLLLMLQQPDSSSNLLPAAPFSTQPTNSP